MTALAAILERPPRVEYLAPVVELRPRRRRRSSVPVAVCATCQTPFEPSRADARYCSSPCRQRSYRRRQRDTRNGVRGLTAAELADRNEHVRRPEQLETLLAESARMGIVERLPGGRWALTQHARAEYGWALDSLEAPA